MLNPEDFRRHLSRALARKNQSNKGKAAEAESGKKAAAEALEAANKKVAEIDLRLPIKGILSVFREEAGIEEPIKKWGPANGQIAYSLIYESGNSPGSTGSGGRGEVVFPPSRWHEVMGVILNHKAELEIRIKTFSKRKSFMQIDVEPIFPEEEFNPLCWRGFLGEEAYLYQNLHKNGYTSKGDMFSFYSKLQYGPLFDVSSKKGVQQFALTLTNFYVGLKTGQGK